MNAHPDHFGLLAAAWQVRLDAIGRRLAHEMTATPQTTEQSSMHPCAPVDWVLRGDPIDTLCSTIGLDDTDQAILTLALAPEIDARFGVAFGTLAGDGSRRFPTIATALRLVAGTDLPLGLRTRLRPGARLLDCAAVAVVPNGAFGGELTAMIVPAQAIVAVATGAEPVDADISPAIARVVPAAPFAQACADVDDLVAHLRLTGEGARVIAIEAEDEPDPEAIALAAREAGFGLLRLDAARLAATGLPIPLAAQRAALVAHLSHAAVLVCDSPPGDHATERAVRDVVRAALPAGVPVVLSTRACPSLLGPEDRIPMAVVQHARPAARERRALWHRAIYAGGILADPEDVAHVASRFPLAGPAIRAAVADAALEARRVAGGAPVASRAMLVAAAKRRSRDRLAAYATRVPARLTLADIVLPPATRTRVQQVVAAIRGRETVYGTWDFSRRGHAASGLCILFSGVSGVGKTATAAAIAAELDGHDLFRINLAAVVSKYIGETEKNLDNIFEAARGSDALLFFDEADALFGKRSEVNDAHDRYANLETAYLLQKMESHEGVSILATNLARNIDSAFARRIHYTVEFPRPDATQRRELWRRLLDVDAPLADDIDFLFLADRFELTGGDIRAAALDAAFLAAPAGGPIGMRDLVRAVARTLVKHGRPVQGRDFRPHEALLSDGP